MRKPSFETALQLFDSSNLFVCLFVASHNVSVMCSHYKYEFQCTEKKRTNIFIISSWKTWNSTLWAAWCAMIAPIFNTRSKRDIKSSDQSRSIWLLNFIAEIIWVFIFDGPWHQLWLSSYCFVLLLDIRVVAADNTWNKSIFSGQPQFFHIFPLFRAVFSRLFQFSSQLIIASLRFNGVDLQSKAKQNIQIPRTIFVCGAHDCAEHGCVTITQTFQSKYLCFVPGFVLDIYSVATS